MPSKFSDVDSVQVLISYAHKDERYKKLLYNHLTSLIHQGLIKSWDDQQIMAGSERNQEIFKYLDEADIILCLLSPDFMFSEYRHVIEEQRVLERRAAGEVEVIPIIIRPVSWKNTLFGKFQALPKNERAITISPNRDKVLVEVAEEVARVAEEISGKNA